MASERISRPGSVSAARHRCSQNSCRWCAMRHPPPAHRCNRAASCAASVPVGELYHFGDILHDLMRVRLYLREYGDFTNWSLCVIICAPYLQNWESFPLSSCLSIGGPRYVVGRFFIAGLRGRGNLCVLQLHLALKRSVVLARWYSRQGLAGEDW